MIQLHDIGKRYDDHIAVRRLSLRVERGEIMVLLGPSGCGKTTTLRLIAGLERPDTGQIWLDGRPIAGDGAWVAPEDRQIGLVFQDYALFPHLTTGSNITFGLNRLPRDRRAARVEEMLSLVGLDGLKKRMPHQLSGGQQQRVALARALAPHPAVLLLDEPFSNLDTALRAQVRGEIKRILKSTDVTTIFVTHDQDEALSLCDRVAVMFDGELAQVGTPREVYNRPATREVAQFIGEANFIGAEAHGLTADSLLGQLRLIEAAHGAVEALIRPEMIDLLPIGDSPITAVITWSEFHGHAQRIGLHLADGTALIARADARADWQPHQAVSLRIQQPVFTF